VDSLGIWWVCLEATNSNGCKDTICKWLRNDFLQLILPPNVFSPGDADDFMMSDDDGLKGNDVFNIYIRGEEKYDLIIYDRWGIEVFRSDNKDYDWNGKYQNSGADCPDGTYYYILHYKFKAREKDEPVLNGVVTLMRER
jgi:gliding motility-associated-like protein